MRAVANSGDLPPRFTYRRLHAHRGKGLGQRRALSFCAFDCGTLRVDASSLARRVACWRNFTCCHVSSSINAEVRHLGDRQRGRRIRGRLPATPSLGVQPVFTAAVNKPADIQLIVEDAGAGRRIALDGGRSPEPAARAANAFRI